MQYQTEKLSSKLLSRPYEMRLPEWVMDLPAQQKVHGIQEQEFNTQPKSYERGVKLFCSAALLSLGAGLGATINGLHENNNLIPWFLTSTALHLQLSFFRVKHINNSLGTLRTLPTDMKTIKAFENFSRYTGQLMRKNGVQSFPARVAIIGDGDRSIPDRARSLSNTVAIQPDKNFPTLFIGQNALDNLTKEEFEAVIAHEASHYHNQHNRLYNNVVAVGQIFLLNAAFWLAMSQSVYAIPVLALAAVTLYAQSLGKRIDERRADRNAILATQDPAPLLSALRNLTDLSRARSKKTPIKSKLRSIWRILAAHHPNYKTRVRHAHYVARRHGLNT